MLSLKARKALANAIVESENRRIRKLRRALRWALDTAESYADNWSKEQPSFQAGVRYCEQVLKTVKPE